MNRGGWRNRIVGHGDEAPDQLLANPANWRTHPDAQLKVLDQMMDEVGIVDSVMVNKTTGHIVDGHARVMLALRRGEPSITVDYVELSEEEERKVLLSFDPITAMAGTDSSKLAETLSSITFEGPAAELMDNLVGRADPETETHHGPYVSAASKYREKWQTEEGQRWSMGQHRLLIDDSRQPTTYERLLVGDDASLVYTDPPYGVNYLPTSNKFKGIKNDSLTGDELAAFLAPALKLMVKHSRPNAAFYIWHASSTRREFADAMRAAGLIERQCIIWVKPIAMLGWGDYRWQHEPCFYASKDGQQPRFFGDRTNSTVWHANQTDEQGAAVTIGQGVHITDGAGHGIYILPNKPKTKRVRSFRIENGEKVALSIDDRANDTWQVSRERAEHQHPTEKPSALAKRAIENSSALGEWILDPFAGSGRMMVAAEQTGRRAAMVELVPEYGAVILETAEQLGLEVRLDARTQT